MASGHYGLIVRHFRRLFQEGTVTGMSEGQLLDRFLAQRDEAAFEALVARHGPMVLTVCRHILRDSNDVDDAFQATFLILVRKASSLRQKHLLGNWLYGVAYRVALRARAQAAQRVQRERPGAEEAAVPIADDRPVRDELRPLLHEELNRLPEKYRAPVVLCYLEGQTHESAAEQLRWPVGTVKGRLSRARELLRSRLTRRGLTLAAVVWVEELSRSASAANVPSLLLNSTVQVAVHVAAGPVAAGTLSASVLSLTEGVLKTMWIAKIKMLAALGLAAGVIAGGAGLLAEQVSDGQAAGQPGAAPATDVSAGQGAEKRESDPAGALVTVKKAYNQALDHYRTGQAGSPETVYQWSRRVLETEKALADGGPQVTAALQGHRDRMRELRREVDKRAKAREGSATAPLAAQFYEEEAGMWLAKAESPAEEAAGLSFAAGSGTGSGGGAGGAMAGAMGLGAMMASMQPQPMAGGGGAAMMSGMAPQPGMGGGIGGYSGGIAMSGGSGTVPTWAERLRQARRNPANKRILDKLERPVAMQFPDETPLGDVLKYIESATGDEKAQAGTIPIYLDPRGLSDVEKTPQSPVQLNLEGVPLKTSLRLALHQLGLVYAVKDGVLIITSPGSDLLLSEEDIPNQ